MLQRSYSENMQRANIVGQISVALSVESLSVFFHLEASFQVFHRGGDIEESAAAWWGFDIVASLSDNKKQLD